MAPVLAIRNGMEAQFDLCINYLLHGGVFDAGQLLLPSLAIVQVCARYEEVFRTEQRAEVLCSEGRVSV